jgi:hypothetical protein
MLFNWVEFIFWFFPIVMLDFFRLRAVEPSDGGCLVRARVAVLLRVMELGLRAVVGRFRCLQSLLRRLSCTIGACAPQPRRRRVARLRGRRQSAAAGYYM